MLDTLLREPTDDLHRQRARRLLDEFEAECSRREQLIGDPSIAPESIRAELAGFAERPERFLP